jgi:hypothetical protein
VAQPVQALTPTPIDSVNASIAQLTQQIRAKMKESGMDLQRFSLAVAW